MKSLFALLCITLTVSIVFSSRANTDEINLYELDGCPPTYNPRFPIDFSWLIERYDFDQIEEYIDEYYGTYYRGWERYLTSKQREIAGKFGLSNIFFKPNLRCYENTKIVFSKGIWNDRLLLRYLAPIGDMKDFELFIAVRPHRFVRFIAKGHINGGRSIVLVVNRSFGIENGSRKAARRARRLLGKVERLVKRN